MIGPLLGMRNAPRGCTSRKKRSTRTARPNSTISDLIPHNLQGEQISRTREGPQDNIIDPVNHRRELLLFGRHIKLPRSITPPFGLWIGDIAERRKKKEASSDETGVSRKCSSLEASCHFQVFNFSVMVFEFEY